MTQIKSDTYRTFVLFDDNQSILIDLRRSLCEKYGNHLCEPKFNLLMSMVHNVFKIITDDEYYGE